MTIRHAPTFSEQLARHLDGPRHETPSLAHPNDPAAGGSILTGVLLSPPPVGPASPERSGTGLAGGKRRGRETTAVVRDGQQFVVPGVASVQADPYRRPQEAAALARRIAESPTRYLPVLVGLNVVGVVDRRPKSHADADHGRGRTWGPDEYTPPRKHRPPTGPRTAVDESRDWWRKDDRSPAGGYWVRARRRDVRTLSLDDGVNRHAATTLTLGATLPDRRRPDPAAVAAAADVIDAVAARLSPEVGGSVVAFVTGGDELPADVADAVRARFTAGELAGLLGVDVRKGVARAARR